MSLETLDEYGYSISKQGLDARFGPKSTLVTKTIFEKYLLKCNQSFFQCENLNWMSAFTEVNVKDGTRFDLPEEFKDKFKGFGGKCTSDSAICIQLEYDLKSGAIRELKTTSANIPDSKDTNTAIGDVKPGSLILRDLGYFVLHVFQDIIDNLSSINNYKE